VVWVLKIILFDCVCGFFIDAVVFCDYVTWKLCDKQYSVRVQTMPSFYSW